MEKNGKGREKSLWETETRRKKLKRVEMWIRRNIEWRKQTKWQRFCDHLKKRHLYHCWLSHHQAVPSPSPLSVTQKALHSPFFPLCTIVHWHTDGVDGQILGALQLTLYEQGLTGCEKGVYKWQQGPLHYFFFRELSWNAILWLSWPYSCITFNRPCCKIMPYPLLPEEQVSIVFFKALSTQEENGAAAFPNISIFLKTSFLLSHFHTCFSPPYSLICYVLAER